jgi:acyl-CoA hydrolase
MPVVFPETNAEIQAFDLAMERRKAHQYKHVASPLLTAEEEVETNYVEKLFPSVSADASLLQYTHIVLPPYANHMGNTFGGQILQWAEESAVMSATMHINSSKKQNNNIFYYFDSAKWIDGAETFEDFGLTATLTLPNFLLSTIYVNKMSFLSPSSVGDRISFKSQVCRTFGSVIEVEVIVTASDVSQSSVRHINTGYFAISCKEASSDLDIYVSPVLPLTVEQKERHHLSLKRMMLASIRSASNTTALDNPLALDEFSSQSNFIQLSSMLKMQETSIWNSDLPSSLTLSPMFEVECAVEFALQDVCSLVASIGASESWNRIPLEMHGTSLQIKNPGKGDNVILVKFSVEIAVSLEAAVALVLDLSRRQEWDSIMHTSRIVKNLVENEIDIVHMGTEASSESNNNGVDYCLLRSCKTLEDGRVVVASRSIVYDGCGQDSTLYTRGELLPSGYVLTEVPQPLRVAAGTLIEATEGSLEGSRNSTSSSCSNVKMDYLLQLDETSAEMLSGKGWCVMCNVHII